MSIFDHSDEFFIAGDLNAGQIVRVEPADDAGEISRFVRCKMHRDHRAVDVNSRHTTPVDDAPSQLGGRVVGDDFLTGLVAGVAHAGEAAVQLEPDNSGSR